MISFGIVGTGWRTEFFLRIAAACPDVFRVAGLVGRTPAKTEELGRRFGVPVFATIPDLAREARPLFVVSSVSWAANPHVIAELVALGLPVLSETPPASSVAEMEALFALVRDGGAKIQVAEQYFLQPMHAARLAFARDGRLGRVTQAQISVAHGYHGISLIRRFLGIGFEDATITASTFKSPLVKGPGRAGPPAAETVVESEQLFARFDFGDRLGLFDFTGDQYFGNIRDPRVLVRGERGEIQNDSAVYLRDHLTPIRLKFRRDHAGEFGDLSGHHLRGVQAGDEWIYQNPVAPARLFDDEIAIADCLLKMAEHARGGPDFYSLAEACQDRYLDILMHESAKTGQPVRSTPQVWASGS